MEKVKELNDLMRAIDYDLRHHGKLLGDTITDFYTFRKSINSAQDKALSVGNNEQVKEFDKCLEACNTVSVCLKNGCSKLQKVDKSND